MKGIIIYDNYTLLENGDIINNRTKKPLKQDKNCITRITYEGKRKSICSRKLVQQHFIEPTLKLKPIPGYEGYYSASYDGHIYSHFSKNFIYECNNNKGYPSVRLSVDNKAKTFQVHRLVAMAWIPCDNYNIKEVNHIDENKENNCVDNLEWCSSEYNLSYNDNSRIYKGWETRKDKQQKGD